MLLRLPRLLLSSLIETALARFKSGPLQSSWGFGFEWMVRGLRGDFLETAHYPLPRLRQELDARYYPSRATRQVRRVFGRAGGVPVVTFSPPETRSDGVLLFFHGGSYILGSPRTTHGDLIARLALAARVRVVAPEYSLAPEHPYPAALHDALAVFEALTAETTADRVLVAGDSAGGNLALALQLARRDRQLPQARGALLISPWLDLTASRPSCRRNEAHDYGNTTFLLRHARAFAGGLELDDPRLSLINAELTGLAPLLVQVGGAERLYDEGVELVRRATGAGVDAHLDVAPEMPHNPPVLAAYHPVALRAEGVLSEHIAAWLAAPRQALPSPTGAPPASTTAPAAEVARVVR